MQFRTLVLATLLAACGSDQDPPDPPADIDAPPAPTPDAAEPDAPGDPAIAVVAPTTPVVRGSPVMLTVTPMNFMLVNPNIGLPVMPGQGHFHYYLDDAIDYTAGWASTVKVRTTNEWSPGEHTVRFVLVNGVHEEIEPHVETTVTFTLE